jgi:tRNA threonylcarbamoyladenosine biosynthesis protein TsaB
VKILAFDSSSEQLSCALWQDGHTVEEDCHAGQRHSDLLLPLIDALLKHTALRLRELDGIAFGAGPGSFTGLRVACGVAQGLAFGARLPVIGIPTLLALAQGVSASRVIACLDARMDEIYYAAYEKIAAEWRTVNEPALLRADAVPELADSGWVGCGSGFAAHREALQRRYQGKLVRIVPDARPSARHIAALAGPLFAKGRGGRAMDAHPLYLRDKVALKISER